MYYSNSQIVEETEARVDSLPMAVAGGGGSEKIVQRK